MLLEEGQTAQYALRGQIHRKKTVGMIKCREEKLLILRFQACSFQCQRRDKNLCSGFCRRKLVNPATQFIHDAIPLNSDSGLQSSDETYIGEYKGLFGSLRRPCPLPPRRGGRAPVQFLESRIEQFLVCKTICLHDFGNGGIRI